MKEWLSNIPIPYWIGHAAFALLIASILAYPLGYAAGLVGGAFFYIGREYTQWESGLKFDWRGLVAPLVACTIVYLILKLSMS